MRDDHRVQNALRVALQRMLTPIARIATKLGMTYRDFEALSKATFINAAAESEHSHLTGAETNAVKAVATSVSRVLDLPVPEIIEQLTNPIKFPSPKFNDMVLPGEVLSEWYTNSDYQDDLGEPIAIPYDGDDISFMSLLKHKGTNSLPGIAVLRELINAECVVRTPNGQLQAISRSYIPAHSLPELLHRSGIVVRRIVETLEHNLSLSSLEQPRFVERSCLARRIPPEAVPEILRYVKALGVDTINEMDSHLGSYEQPLHTENNKNLLDVGLGMYFFVDRRDELRYGSEDRIDGFG